MKSCRRLTLVSQLVILIPLNWCTINKFWLFTFVRRVLSSFSNNMLDREKKRYTAGTVRIIWNIGRLAAICLFLLSSRRRLETTHDGVERRWMERWVGQAWRSEGSRPARHLCTKKKKKSKKFRISSLFRAKKGKILHERKWHAG